MLLFVCWDGVSEKIPALLKQQPALTPAAFPQLSCPPSQVVVRDREQDTITVADHTSGYKGEIIVTVEGGNGGMRSGHSNGSGNGNGAKATREAKRVFLSATIDDQ